MVLRYTPTSKALEFLSCPTDPVLREDDHEPFSREIVVTKITQASILMSFYQSKNSKTTEKLPSHFKL